MTYIFRKVAGTVSVTVLMIGVTGAAIYQLVFPFHPYSAAVGFSGYMLIVSVVMLLRIVRLHRNEPNLEEIHSLIADTNNTVTELKDYVERNI